MLSKNTLSAAEKRRTDPRGRRGGVFERGFVGYGKPVFSAGCIIEENAARVQRSAARRGPGDVDLAK
jgi:hypothetical protein